MESIFGQDPYVASLVAGLVYFAAVAAAGTLVCWIAGHLNPQGGVR